MIGPPMPWEEEEDDEEEEEEEDDELRSFFPMVLCARRCR